MRMKIPESSLVVLIGPSSSGKTTFSKKHFINTQVVSPDYCSYLISDKENDQLVSKQAYDLLYTIVDKRLGLKKLTIIDDINVLESDRYELLEIARKHNALTVAIVFNLPDYICLERNKTKIDRELDKDVIKYQINQVQFSLLNLKKEGFNYVYVLNSEREVNYSSVYINSLYCDRSFDHGPFDIIGDVHGCYDELVLLLKKLGYKIEKIDGDYNIENPSGRKVIFLGDLVDRGPKIVDVLKITMQMVKEKKALCVQGNHDNKLYRKLIGNNVQIKNGLEDSLEQLKQTNESFLSDLKTFLKHLESHYVLDDQKLVVVHAGMKEDLIGRSSKKVRSFALYGETTGETDEFGLPIRYLWAKDYKGKALILYGHTPNKEIKKMNNTINIDTGCVFGNKLTAYRYPEGDFVEVIAKASYSQPSRPIK